MDISLLYALRYQLSKDTTEYKLAMANKVLANSIKGRIFLEMAKFLPPPLKVILALLWASLKICTKRHPQGEKFYLFSSAVEQEVLLVFLNTLSVRDAKPIRCDFKISLASSLSPPTLPSKKLVKVTHRLVKNYPFFAALRSLETIFYFIKFKSCLDKKANGSFYISTLSQPYSSAVLGLKRKGLIKAHFKSHSPLIDSPRKVFLDSAHIYGKAMKWQFELENSSVQHYHFTGAGIGPVKLDFSDSEVIVVALSKGPDWSRLKELLELIDKENHLENLSVGLRCHPNQLGMTPRSFERLVMPRESFSKALQKAHFVIAGNSTVHLHSMALGVPSFYSPLVDSFENLDLKFVEEVGIKMFDKNMLSSREKAHTAYPQSVFVKVRNNFYNTSL